MSSQSLANSADSSWQILKQICMSWKISTLSYLFWLFWHVPQEICPIWWFWVWIVSFGDWGILNSSLISDLQDCSNLVKLGIGGDGDVDVWWSEGDTPNGGDLWGLKFPLIQDFFKIFYLEAQLLFVAVALCCSTTTFSSTSVLMGLIGVNKDGESWKKNRIFKESVKLSAPPSSPVCPASILLVDSDYSDSPVEERPCSADAWRTCAQWTSS